MRKVTQFFDTDVVETVEEQILNNLRSSKNKPHQKLLSKRKMSKLLGVTEATIQTCVANLAKKGFLYTKPRSGTFLSDLLFQTPSDNRPQTSFYSPNYSNKGTICVAFSPQESPEQIKMWKKVIQGFTNKYPFYKVDPDFSYNDGKGTLKDVTIFTLPCLVSLADNLLDLTGFSDFSDGTASLCPGITELCRTENGIKAMPILRFSSMLSVNRKLLANAGINSGEIKEPVDLFRAGAKAEAKSSGKYGCRYLGFIYHAATYGIVLKRENAKILFDHEKVKEFLQDFQPWIRKHHFMDHGESGIQHFLNNEYVLHPDFFCCYPLFAGHPDLDIMPFPVKEGGFVCEGIHVAGISKESEKKEDAFTFLKYLTGSEAQKILVNQAPHWLAVNKNVLAEQKLSSPFRPGTIRYDFDSRSYYSQVDDLIFRHVATKFNIEAGKYFLGLQSIEQTLERLEKA